MKTNFRKLLSVVLSLVLILACLTSVSITTLAEETTTDEVVVKKGPFDFTNETDLAYGNGATVEDGKVKIDIKNANGAAWMRIPYEIVSGTDYSVRFKIKVIATGWMHLTLKTAYAQGNGVGFEHTNTAHIASKIDYPNTITKNEWTDIEYSFTANNPSEEYKYLGLFIQTSVAAEIYIDNLQIEPSANLETGPQNATFDFSDASHLEYAVAKYGNGSAAVADGALNLALQNNRCMKARFPFELQNGKTYKVKYDLTISEDKALLLGIANASSTNSYDGVFNEGNRFTISNGNRTAGTHTVEYTFVADITDASYNKLGLIFWATAADASVTVDNLEISVVDTEKAYYDFSDASHLEYAAAKYGNGSASVADGALNLALQNNRCMKVRFPFALQDGKEYRVSYDLTVSEDKALLLGIANASSTNSYDGVFNEGNRLTISNGNRTAGTHTVEYTFVADITDANYNKLGLIFWATAADAAVTIDNLEISVVDYDKAYYDFLSSSDVADSYISYSNAVFQDEMLKLSIPSANCRAKVKFPFKLQNGETYRVRFDIKADTAMENLVQIAYAGTGTEDALIVHGTNTIAGSWEALNSEFKTLEYTFTAACPENNENIGIYINAGSVSGNVIYIDNFYILKDYLAPNTPNAPDMASHTENSITLMDMRGYEYKIDDGEWQTSPVFENLVQGQTYSFYQRVAATDIYGATSASEAFQYFIAYYGDADRDGNVAAADLTLMRNVLLDSNDVYDEFAADLNKNGILDAVDLVKLKKELAQKKNPVTPEFLGSNYKIAWNDEFEGESLDSSKWNTGTYDITDNGYDGVTHIAKDGNAGVLEVADGYLKLNNYAVANESGGMDYYTPEICTNKNYNFSYGYFEMRAKLTSGNPLWHSFWACGAYTDDKPYKAEIDVIETYSYGANIGTYDYTVHSWWDKNAANLPDFMANNSTGHKRLFTDSVTDNSLATQFHNYGCLWTETSITFYLDGEVLKEVKFADDANSDYFLALKEGNPMFLVLSLSTAREYAGTINNDTLASQQMLVDYVRVFQCENS